MTGPLHLVVLGDSFCFTDGDGPVLPGDPGVWPTIAGRLVGDALGRSVEVAVLARPGRTVRDALALVRKDQHVQFEVLPRADAVVVAVGSHDHAPLGVPAPVGALVPYLRPNRLRRAVRRLLHRAHPRIVRATGGRFARTPAAAFERDLTALLGHVRAVARGAAGVVLGPSSHRSDRYAHVHPLFGDREDAQLRIATAEGFATVPVWTCVEQADEPLNEDGVHWPTTVHRAVATAVAAALVAQLRDGAVRPPVPTLGTPDAAVAPPRVS